MIKVENFAKDIQQKLEDIAYSEFGDKHPQFNITDDMQIYQNRRLKKGGRRYTPGILRVIPGAISPATVWGVYTGQYQLEIYGYRDEKRKIQQIFRDFASENNNVPYEPELGYEVVEDNRTGMLTVGELIIDEFNDSDDGVDEESFVAYLDIVFSIFIGGLSAKETSLTIDNTPIPFDEIQYKQDKSLISNIAYKDGASNDPNIDNKLVSELLILNIPLNVDTSVDTFINRVLDNTYNDKYSISWNLTDTITKTGDYVVRSAFIQYNQQNEAIGILVSFENTTSAITFQLDGESVPVLKSTFSATRATDAFNEVDEEGNIEIKQLNTSYTYGIGITFLFDETKDSIKRLFKEITENTTNVSHTITIEGPEKISNYEVILKEGSWDFDEKANLTITATFVGEKNI